MMMPHNFWSNEMQHIKFMQLCIEQAKKAFECSEVPIGAVIVMGQKVLSKSFNQVELLKDGTAHAEILAISQACGVLRTKFLNDAIMYINIEPCLMCYGAIKNVHIKHICFGAKEPKSGFTNFIDIGKENISVKQGLLADASFNLMRHFFKTKR